MFWSFVLRYCLGFRNSYLEFSPSGLGTSDFLSFPLAAINRRDHSYVGIVRGGIMVVDGKGGDAL
jgi:hypothetical protein